MWGKKKGLTYFLMALFIICSLPITSPVSGDSDVDNWPENDAWLHIELISWSANETVEWDSNGCLLYTSDAADDSLRVDLGGRRIIKKNTDFFFYTHYNL